MSNVTFEHDLEINAGDDQVESFVWDIDGTPVNLLGATARVQLRADEFAETVLYTATTANGLIEIDGAAGEIAVTFTDTGTASLDSPGVWDLELTHATGDKQTLIRGKYYANKKVTR